MPPSLRCRRRAAPPVLVLAAGGTLIDDAPDIVGRGTSAAPFRPPPSPHGLLLLAAGGVKVRAANDCTISTGAIG